MLEMQFITVIPKYEGRNGSSFKKKDKYQKKSGTLSGEKVTGSTLSIIIIYIMVKWLKNQQA